MPYLPAGLRRSSRLRADRQTAQRLLGLLEKALHADTPSEPTPDKGPAAPGVDRTADVGKLAESITAMRDDLRKFGAALGAGASAVVVGLGWTTLHNIYPVPAAHPFLLGWGAFLLALLAAGAAIYLAAQFFAAQRRIVFKPSDPQQANGLNAAEKDLVEDVLREHAQEENASDALALELRAMRFGRIARTGSAADARAVAAAAAESSRLYATLALAEARAALAVLERRSQQLFTWTGRPAQTAAVAVVAVVGLFLLADYSKGERDRIDLLAKCQKAVTAGAPTACDTVVQPKAGPPTSASPTPTATPSANTAIIQRAADCANYKTTPALTGVLRDIAVARCAGLPLPSTSAAGPTK